jgi:histidinol dehydrogenase
MSMTVSFYDLAKLSNDERSSLMMRTEGDLSKYLEAVKPIIAAVRAEGDSALARFAGEFDKAPVAADAIKVSPQEFDAAFDVFDPAVAESIRFAAESIRIFHKAQMPEKMRMAEVRPGTFCGERFIPIPSVACYVPRGKGAFPSVLLMTTTPAVVVQVPRISILTPPGPDGRVDAATLVAARLVGVENVYKCGGAQAVAAAAYGTATVPKAHKIIGPGSPWVVAAKRLLADVIDPGTPAGPSESIVLADETADGRIAALDINAAIDFVNDYAPEHLAIQSREPFSYLSRITNAGEILLGENTPLSIANYVLGPNAVLPTSGAARIHSPLSVYDFLKMSSVGYVTAAAYDQLAGHAHRLAVYEGFDGHALAVSDIRKKLLQGR